MTPQSRPVCPLDSGVGTWVDVLPVVDHLRAGREDELLFWDGLRELGVVFAVDERLG